MAATGAISVDKLEGNLDLSSRSNPVATGGRASTGLVVNTSSAGGSIGLVKMLAIAGVALLAYRIFRRK